MPMNRSHLVTLLLVLASGARAPAAETIVPNADGAATRDFEVVVKSAKIKPTKANGSKWDVGNGNPDPFVRVSILDGGKFTRTGQTKVVKDTLTPLWDEVVLAVDVGEVVVLSVK